MNPSLKPLLSLEPPWLYLSESSESSMYTLAWHLSGLPGVIVRTIRGKKCSTAPHFFDEAGAALQFPAYFGENWDAFDECVCDLQWLKGIAVVVIVVDAELLLAKEPMRLPVLMRALNNAGREWSIDGGSTRPLAAPRPFHVILQSELPEADFRAQLGLGSEVGVFDPSS